MSVISLTDLASVTMYCLLAMKVAFIKAKNTSLRGFTLLISRARACWLVSLMEGSISRSGRVGYRFWRVAKSFLGRPHFAGAGPVNCISKTYSMQRVWIISYPSPTFRSLWTLDTLSHNFRSKIPYISVYAYVSRKNKQLVCGIIINIDVGCEKFS